MNPLKKLLLWLILPSERRMKKIAKDIVNNLKVIDLYSEGFSISSGGKVQAEYAWKDIDNARIYEDRIELFKQEKIAEVIHDDAIDYYAFIQRVPKGFADFDYAFIEAFFNDLKGCVCCGLIAIPAEKCLACGFEVWNESLSEEYPSEQEYIREHQHDLFEPFENELINIHNKPEQGFTSDPTWVPLVKASDYSA